MNIKQYKDVDHPFHLPGQIDLFSWSMPFLIEKVTEIVVAMNKRAIGGTSEKDIDYKELQKLLEN